MEGLFLPSPAWLQSPCSFPCFLGSLRQLHERQEAVTKPRRFFAMDYTSLSLSPYSLIFPTKPLQVWGNGLWISAGLINYTFVYTLLSWSMNSWLVVIVHCYMLQISCRGIMMKTLLRLKAIPSSVVDSMATTLWCKLTLSQVCTSYTRTNRSGTYWTTFSQPGMSLLGWPTGPTSSRTLQILKLEVLILRKCLGPGKQGQLVTLVTVLLRDQRAIYFRNTNISIWCYCIKIHGVFNDIHESSIHWNIAMHISLQLAKWQLI